MSNIPPITRSISMVNAIMSSKAEMTDLNRQLGTGQVSQTYGGLGNERVVSIAMRARMSAIDGYMGTADIIATRLSIVGNALDRMDAITGDARSTTLIPGYDLNGGNRSSAQTLTRNYLDEFLSLLNTDVAGRYMFGGRVTDEAPVVGTQQLLDGDGARDGFRQVSAERLMADQGSDGRGRFSSSVTANTVTFAEDGVHPFGFKLSAINAIGSSASVTAPSGAPANGGLTFTSVPAAGEQINVTLTLPDGSEKVIKLTATTSSPPGDGAFTIGSDVNATAANFQSSFDTALLKAGQVELAAASAMQASKEFFNIDNANPPLRVDGPPYDTATALVAGTSADTVFWYKGDGATDDPRLTANARIDDSITASYGMRANEAAFRNVVASLAVFATATFSASDPNSEDRYRELASKVTKAFSPESGEPTVRNVAAQIAGVKASVDSTKERLTLDRTVAEGVVADIETADTEEVAVRLLQLQNRLQATYQTTAILANLSIMDYL
ncbi:MAG: flagellin [Flavobacteriaceae bacterium]